jgi:hypothetical protein
MTDIEETKQSKPEEEGPVKHYNLFETISLELLKDNDILASRHENGVRFNLASLTSIQGMAGFGEVVYILGTVSAEYPKHATQNVIMVCSRDKVLTINAHYKNYGIWGISSKGMEVIVTVGADIERTAEVGSQLNTTIMIWDPEELMERKNIRREYDDELKGVVYKPRVVPIDRHIYLEQVSSVQVEAELRMIALGLNTGAILIIKAGDVKLPNLYLCAENRYEYFYLQPEPGLELPVTNIYVGGHNKVNGVDLVFCTCEKGFYSRTFGKKVKSELKYVSLNSNIDYHSMSRAGNDFIIFDSNRSKIMKFRQEMQINMVNVSKTLEKGVSVITKYRKYI